MSEILSIIDVNNYGIQSMVAGTGGGKEQDLTIELGAQDTALSTQVTTIDQLESALDNKIALDLADATSDANATTNDIAKDKTAYVNGVKLTGTAEPPVPDWSQIGYSEVPQVLLDDFDYAKQIYNNWDGTQNFARDNNIVIMPLIDTSSQTSFSSKFSNCHLLHYIPLLDTSNVTNFSYAFDSCTSLTKIPLLNTSSATSLSGMFYNCQYLQEVPLLDTSNVTNFNEFVWNCNSLSNESLNNILAMCINATSYSRTKTLKYIGLSSTQATTCQTLSNWDAFVAAGWSTGY